MTAILKYPNLLSPIQIGALKLKNRTIMGSMHTGLEDSREGLKKLAVFYEERAKGGVGLIVTGGFAPNKTGWLIPFSGKLTSQGEVKKHRELTHHVQQAGAPMLLQILHAGRYSYHPLAAAPSALKSPIAPFAPWEMSARKIQSTIEDFARCAELAAEAGYKGVEIMGSEGYLINEFLALKTNQRKDDWGGSFANRMRFPLEIVKRTRQRVGRDFVLMFRLSLLDLVDQGSSTTEMIELGKALQGVGVDVLNTGIGWHEARVPTIATSVPRAAFAWATQRLKSEVQIPVVAANRINTPEIAENLISQKYCDLVSMARPFLADADFVNKAKENRADEINTCIACNQGCLDQIFQKKRATCLVNPRACYETELPLLPAEIKKNIVIIGAGPAGLSCAVTAAQRGHKVTIYDQAAEIGGQFNLAKRIPGKSEFNETIRYFKRQIELHQIDVKLNSPISFQELESLKADEIVIATGARPRKIQLEGSDLPSVVSYAEVIRGQARIGKKVAIIGAGGIGFDVAEYLAYENSKTEFEVPEFLRQWGINSNPASSATLQPKEHPSTQRTIYLLQRKPGKLGATLGKTTGWIHRNSLLDAGVEMLNAVEYLKVDARGLHIRYRGEIKLLKVDNVVICAGQTSENRLADELKSKNKKFHLIGGAFLAAELDAKRAILDGATVAMKF